MLSNLKIYNMSQAVVPPIKQDTKIVLENKTRKVEAISGSSSNMNKQKDSSNQNNANYLYAKNITTNQIEIKQESEPKIDIRI